MNARVSCPPSPLSGKTVILDVAGSIAACKAADFARKLTQPGAIVRPALAEDAKKFVTPLAFQSVTHQSR